MDVAFLSVRGDIKKIVVLGGGGRWGKKTTPFCFCFHSIQKPSKRVKTQCLPHPVWGWGRV